MERAEYMHRDHQARLRGLPRDHGVCKDYTGVFRPGKTAKDRANRKNRGGPTE